MISLKRKQWIDYYIGSLVIFVLKPLVIFLGKILKRDHSLIPKKNILIIKMLGGGSLIIALPALLGLRQKYPSHHISILTTPAVRQFAASINIFDEIIVIEDSSAFKLVFSSFKALIKTFGVDTVLDFEVYSRLSAVFSVLTCARNRLGFFLESTFLRENIYTHLLFFNRYASVYLFYDEIVGLMDANIASIESCRTHVLKNILISNKVFCSPPRHTLIIGHACSELSLERMLKPSEWKRVLKKMLLSNTDVYFLGAKKDFELGEQIIDKCSPDHPNVVFLNLCGKTTLIQSLSLMAGAQEFIGIDSALLHYARLFGLKCTSFWGPTDPIIFLRSPNQDKEKIFYHKVSCSPCVHITEKPPCGGKNICIKKIFDKDKIQVSQSWPIFFNKIQDDIFMEK